MPIAVRHSSSSRSSSTSSGALPSQPPGTIFTGSQLPLETAWLRARAPQPLETNPATVRIDGHDDSIRAERIIIAVGTRPARPRSVAFVNRPSES